MAMIRGPRWKRWAYFYVPLWLYMIGLLFPFYWMLVTSFRPDNELYRSWRAATNTPLWTLNPTLEAQFSVELTPTRLPTFTPPPPLMIPAFVSEENAHTAAGLPMGFVIVGLLVVGFFGTLISLLRGR